LQDSSISNSIRNKLTEIAKRVTGNSIIKFSDSDILVEAGLIDSAGIIEFVIWIEDSFDFIIGDNEVTIENLGSISSVTNFVASRTGS